MKRKLILIIAVLLAVCLCSGVVFAKIISPDDSFADLSDEDMALKTKISEISDTKVDFRHNKQEKVQNKTFDISFKEINSENSAVKKAIYTNNMGDEFKYDIETGKLVEASIDSNIVIKTKDSIDIETAHKIALQHFPKDCDITKYTQYANKETDNGYFFWYTRYVGRYSTSDSFSITIGYDGSIITFHDATDSISWGELDIDEEYINIKIQEFANKNGISKIQGDYVCTYQGKICVYCSFGDEYENITNVLLE